MSYHLALRGLQLSRRTPKVGTFVDCLVHSLDGDLPAAQLRQQMHALAAHQLTVESLSDRVHELLAVDLNPLGQLLRLGRSAETYRRAWDCYDQYGNVVGRVSHSGVQHSGDVTPSAVLPHLSRLERVQGQAAHERLVQSFYNAFTYQWRGNQNAQVLARKVEDSAVSRVARVYAMDALIVELSECFEADPSLNVTQACVRLGVHPRLLERRMRRLGMTPVLLKQACMLTQATQQILMGSLSFSEVANRCGYANGAHLARTVARATGGFSPTLLREFMRAQPATETSAIPDT